MIKSGVILGDELSNGLGTLKTQNKVIQYEPLPASLVDDNFLNGLSFVDIHGLLFENLLSLFKFITLFAKISSQSHSIHI